MNKKGFDVGFWPPFVIAILVFMIVLGVTSSTWAAVKRPAIEAQCAQSIALQQGTQVRTLLVNKDSPLDTQCERMSLTFEKDKAEVVMLRDGKVLETKKYDEFSEYEVYKATAEELKWCWERVAAGEAEAYNSDYLDLTVLGLTKKSNICHFCTEIYFDRDLPDLQLTGFYDFLQEEPVKGQDMTYWEYLTNPNTRCYNHETGASNKGVTCWEYFADEEGFVKDLTISTGYQDNYVVFFVRYGLEKDESTMFAYVAPKSQLANYCNLVLL